ncbi:MAG: peptide chain release factor N(5)-glutamine methyltransferase [Dehalococcoidia bacterium]|nr:peptide chain release factor N(5)-glutamine methyltransferase [Dehalococcoidia bacterium]
MSKALAENRIEAGMQEASILLQHVTAMTPTDMYCNLQQSLSASEAAHLKRLLQRRLCHEPLQYIIGSSTFYGLEFHVDHRVLIPRPETELLVDIVLALGTDILAHDGHVHIADVGTGSGAIAITVATHLAGTRVVAVDASRGALAVAAINRKKHSASRQVDLVQGDLLAPFQRTFDIVVANLPYIDTETIEELSPEVRCFEPRMALDGGADGLRHVGRLLRHAETALIRGGWLLLELGAGQSTSVLQMMADAGCWLDIDARCDLQGIERVVMGRYKEG